MTSLPRDLERYEKASSLVRNVVVIGGAILTAALFVVAEFDDPVVVTVSTLFVGADNMLLASARTDVTKSVSIPQDKQGKLMTQPAQLNVSGKLGEVQRVFIRNTGKNPVRLEVKIPENDYLALQSDEEEIPKSSIFTLVDATPTCAIKKSEVEITNGGVLTRKEIGTISVPVLPPDCSLRVNVARTGASASIRFMQSDVEVFYDGKRAKVKRGVFLYGWIGRYAEIIEERGVLGIIVFAVAPFILFLMFVLLLTEQLARLRRKSSQSHQLLDANSNSKLASQTSNTQQGSPPFNV